MGFLALDGNFGMKFPKCNEVPFMGLFGGAPTVHRAPNYQKMAGQPFSGKNGRPRQRAHILP